jgi:ribulose-phosphate 3-epimerase
MSANKSDIMISPSLLSADPLIFGEELASVEAAGADLHHIDVMDGNFVPNLTFGLPLIRSIKAISKKPLDVHIMVANPDEVAQQYLDAGADILSFHVEVAKHSHRIIQSIQKMGRKAGVAINPGTALELVLPLIHYADVIMVMSVNPGFGGQSFIEETIGRIEALAREIAKAGRSKQCLIEVDGGITSANVSRVIAAGARMIVAGTAVYGEKDRTQAIAKLKKIAKKG